VIEDTPVVETPQATSELIEETPAVEVTPVDELSEPATTPELVEDVPARFTPGGSRPTQRAGVPWWTFAAIPFVIILVVKRRRRCVHCDRRLTEVDGILIDSDNNDECALNDGGVNHQFGRR
ncbi:MAG: hypothetical protein VX285_07240, partial [Actinomycetota bacterium]|nr:hypothetical protein [Actinomycetota bacterium]